MSVSFERAVLLIHIIKGAAELGPREANSISALASMELKIMDDEAKEEIAERSTAKAHQEAAERATGEVEAATESSVSPKTTPTTQVDVARRR